MNITLDAYHFWETQYSYDPDRERSIDQIALGLFLQIKDAPLKDRPWYCWFISLSPYLSQRWIRGKVETALAAYKFDIIGTPEQAACRALFSSEEMRIIDQRVDKIFKKVLLKKGVTSLDDKAKRWAKKVKKYQDKSDYLIASFALDVLSRTPIFSAYQGTINQLKALKQSEIQIYSHLLTRYPHIKEGLKEFLEDPNLDPIQPSWYGLIMKTAKAWVFSALASTSQTVREMGPLTLI